MKKREAKIQSCFSNETEIHIEKEPDELDLLLETFKLRTHYIPDDNVNSLFDQNKKADRLIVMDDVSGVAEISKKLANFLTVSRKFGYHCVYVFHVIAPATQIRQKIISQTFSTFFHLASLKILLQKFYRVTALPNQKICSNKFFVA